MFKGSASSSELPSLPEQDSKWHLKYLQSPSEEAAMPAVLMHHLLACQGLQDKCAVAEHWTGLPSSSRTNRA